MIAAPRSVHASVKQPAGAEEALRITLRHTPLFGSPFSNAQQQQQCCRCRVRATVNASQSSQQQPLPSRQDLEVQLQDAIRLEQYQRAAELRDTLKALQLTDNTFSLKKQLDSLVAQERFEVCLLFTLVHMHCMCSHP